FVVGGPVGDSELLLCHGMVCVVGRMRDLILQLSKSSIYSTKPKLGCVQAQGYLYQKPMPFSAWDKSGKLVKE
ncbi:PTS fructose IIA subunit, partial [Escherichia coli]